MHTAPPPFLTPLDEGIYRVTLPLPFHGLGAVHSFLLRDPGGWTVIDTGLNTPEARAVWQETWRWLNTTPAHLSQILLTHVHPDHFGLAGWLQREAKAAGREVPVYAGSREIELAAVYYTAGPARYAGLEAFFARCGLPPEDRALSETMMAWISRATQPPPAHMRPLFPDAELRAGGRRFRVLHTPGHSDGHLAFFDPDDGLLLIGDHVLPEITPNISLWPTTEPDPLGRYLASLATLAALPVRRILPAHGPDFTDWHGRLAAIDRHHRERLDRMQAAIGRGASVFDVARAAFDLDVLRPDERRFAVTETLAHLEYLVHDGRLAREDDTIWQYRRRTA